MMECGCSCDVYDGDHADLYESHTPKAIKEHQCDECGRTIRKGERYERAKMLHDGDWWEYKTCTQCVAIRRDYGCGAHGSLREDVWECLRVDIRVDGNWDVRIGNEVNDDPEQGRAREDLWRV